VGSGRDLARRDRRQRVAADHAGDAGQVLCRLGRQAQLKEAGLDFSARKSEFQSISGRAVQDPDKFKGSEMALRGTLNNLPNRGGWGDWNQVGMALFAASGGEGWGLAFKSWSQTSPLHGARNASGKGDTTVDRWAHCHRSPPTRSAGAKAIFKMAQECSGWNESSVPGAYPDRPALTGNLSMLQEWTAQKAAERARPAGQKASSDATSEGAENHSENQSSETPSGGKSSNSSSSAQHPNLHLNMGAILHRLTVADHTNCSTPGLKSLRLTISPLHAPVPYSHFPSISRDADACRVYIRARAPAYFGQPPTTTSTHQPKHPD
jgi:hypothetical protein